MWIEKVKLTEFRFTRKLKGNPNKYIRHVCRQCENEQSRIANNAKYKDFEFRTKALTNAKIRHKKNKEYWVSFAGGCCQDCGIKGHSAIYDFHHKNPTIKEFSGLKLLAKARAKEDIINELQNCVLLCANCHRLRHTLIMR